MKKIILFTACCAILLFTANATYARLGVGVATGKVVVEEKLKPGILYHLPPLTVVNTGDVEADYQVVISYFQDQPQLEPGQDWFIFSPQSFHLQPNKVQVVNITLNLPVTAKPGDYFAYLEAHPVQKAKSGVTTIGIAAAAKLYFTVIPANVLQAIYYKIISFWTLYAPWTNYAAIGIVVVICIILIKKNLNIEINRKK